MTPSYRFVITKALLTGFRSTYASESTVLVIQSMMNALCKLIDTL